MKNVYYGISKLFILIFLFCTLSLTLIQCVEKDKVYGKMYYLLIRNEFTASSPIYGSPVLGGSNIYVGSEDGIIYILTRNLDVIDSMATTGAILATPAVGKDNIYFVSQNGSVCSIGLKDNLIKWKFKIDGEVISSPAITGNQLIVATYESEVYGIKTDTLNVTWKYKTRGPIVLPIVVKAGSCVIADDSTIYALETGNGVLVWEYKLKHNVAVAPLIMEDRVFAVDIRGNVSCLDLKTGKPNWTHDLKHGIAADPLINVDEIIVTAMDSVIYFFNTFDGTQTSPPVDVNESLGSSPIKFEDFFLIATLHGKVLSLPNNEHAISNSLQLGDMVLISPLKYLNSVYITGFNGTIYRIEVNLTKL